MFRSYLGGAGKKPEIRGGAGKAPGSLWPVFRPSLQSDRRILRSPVLCPRTRRRPGNGAFSAIFFRPASTPARHYLRGQPEPNQRTQDRHRTPGAGGGSQSAGGSLLLAPRGSMSPLRAGPNVPFPPVGDVGRHTLDGTERDGSARQTGTPLDLDDVRLNRSPGQRSDAITAEDEWPVSA